MPGLLLTNQTLQTYVLLGERVDELREDLVGDDGLSELIRVVGETAEGEGG